MGYAQARVMARKHVIGPGDCIASVALANGFDPDTLWEHPDNAGLREQRESGFLLVPGDVVAVPDLRPREEACATGKRHTFRRRGVPEKLKIRLEDEGEPRARVSYVLVIDGKRTSGTTDEDGKIEVWIPPDARHGELSVEGEPPFPIALGRLPPVSEEMGVRDRLRNLGLLDQEDLHDDHEVTLSLLRFQALHRLPKSGEADDETRRKLVEQHGC